MTMTLIDGSSLIAELGWENLVLAVTFKNKAGETTSTWEYAGVSEEVYLEMLTAPSVGKFYLSKIKGKYDGVKVAG